MPLSLSHLLINHLTLQSHKRLATEFWGISEIFLQARCLSHCSITVLKHLQVLQTGKLINCQTTWMYTNHHRLKTNGTKTHQAINQYDAIRRTKEHGELTVTITVVCVNSSSNETLNSRNILWNAGHVQQTQTIVKYMINTFTEYNQSIINQSIKTNYIAPYVESESEAHKWQRLDRVFTFTVSNVK